MTGSAVLEVDGRVVAPFTCMAPLHSGTMAESEKLGDHDRVGNLVCFNHLLWRAVDWLWIVQCHGPASPTVPGGHEVEYIQNDPLTLLG